MATCISYKVEELDSNIGLFLCKAQTLSPIAASLIELSR